MSAGADAHAMSRHLFIAGTGRAGTSFLVRYLSALGMDTTLSRHGSAAGWDEHANAGLEQPPDALFGSDVPYVVKSPWLYLVVDEVIAKARDRIDGLIVPVRDLSEAAGSRVSIERSAIERAQGVWLDRLDRPWDVWATTPGGVVYSLNPADQARILAAGFHHLIERFVAADLPITFLHFPRIVLDPQYLFSKLQPFLPTATTREDSNAAFAAVVDTSKVHDFTGPVRPSS
jgi:hypothetical protein